MEKTYYFMKYLFEPINLLLTLLGSTLGLIVLSREKLKQIGPRNMYRYLFAFGYLNYLFLIQYLMEAFGLNFLILSASICKIYWLCIYVYLATLPMLYIYISIERLVSISSPGRRFIMRKTRNQTIFIIVVLIYNVTFYSFIFLNTDLFEYHKEVGNITNQTHGILLCRFEDLKLILFFKYMDLINAVLLPYIIMSICTGLLIYKIFVSRKKLYSKNRSTIRFRKDLRISITSIILNLFYLVFNLPYTISIIVIHEIRIENETLYYFFNYLTGLGIGMDFFILIATNSLVRSEFHKILQIKKARFNFM